MSPLHCFLRRCMALRRMTSSAMRPIVAVIGTTGVGKSQLAVSLGQSLPGWAPSSAQDDPSLRKTNSSRSGSAEGMPQKALVLSADSMQLYRGLDVITNKVTRDEMGDVEHWGLDVVVPGTGGGSWEVGRWCGEADRVVSSLPGDTLPIVCGGTHYFIQHFLFPPGELSFERPGLDTHNEDSDSHRPRSPVSAQIPRPNLRWQPPGPLPTVEDKGLSAEQLALLETFWTHAPAWPRAASAEGTDGQSAAGPSTPSPAASSRPTVLDDAQLLSLHSLLAAVDPPEAGRWHWRDGRKVRRGLERWWERGGAGTQAQDEKEGTDTMSKPATERNGRRARFKTLIFWVYDSMEALAPRLDRRVDKMVDRGLLQEIEELRGIATDLYGSPEAADHTEGIFQAIGYKEFAALPLPQPDPPDHPLFPRMLDRMKLSTRQYAKSQLKWIRKQLLPAVREARALGGDVYVYVVPGGPPGEQVAREILQDFLAGRDLPDPRETGHPDAAMLLSVLEAAEEHGQGTTMIHDTAARQELHRRQTCDVCLFNGQPMSIPVRDWAAHLKSKAHKRNAANAAETKEERIARLKVEGLRLKAERQALKEGSGSSGSSGSDPAAKSISA